MPRRKKEDLKIDIAKGSNDDAKRNISKMVPKAAQKKSNNELKSKTTSKISVGAELNSLKSDKKSVVKGGKKRGKIKEETIPLAEAAVEENSLSEYFSVSQGDDNSSVQNRVGKRKMKTEKSFSYASKVKNLKKDVEEADEESDKDFEILSVNYRSPQVKKKKLLKNVKVEEKLQSTSGNVNDGEVCQKGVRRENLCDKKDKNVCEKEKTVSAANRGKKKVPNKLPSSRKRKSDVMEATNEGEENEVKKTKREASMKSKFSKQWSEKSDDMIKRNVNKKPQQAKVVKNNKKTMNEKVKADNFLTILQQVEGKRLENSNSFDSDESSNMEEGMEVKECSANKATVISDIRTLPKSLDHADVMAVLMHMEGPTQSILSEIPSTSKVANDDYKMMTDDDDATDEDSEWEDVEDHHGNSPKKSQLSSGPVEITLDAPVVFKKRKRGGFDLQAYFKRQINKFKREVAMDIHKVHLLSLLSRCQYLNGLCTDETVLAQALSLTLVTKQLQLPPVRFCTENHVTQVLSWIREKKHFLADVMAGGLQELSSQLKVTLICVILLRQVGFLARLMMSLQAVPFRETSNQKGKSAKSSKTSKGKASQKSESKKTKKTDMKKDGKKMNPKITPEKMKGERNEIKKDAKEIADGKDKEPQERSGRKRGKRSSVSRNVYKDQKSSDEEVQSDDEDFIPDDNNDDDNDEKSEVTKGKRKKSMKKSSKRKRTDVKTSVKDEKISDDDFEEDNILMRTQQFKDEPSGEKSKRVFSVENESEDISGVDNWAEVYLQKEQKWICIDCVAVQLKKPYEVENKATQPISYVVGITQEGYIRDVTARYASQWLTETRKVRVDNEWWEETLEPYMCPDSQRNKIEDEELNSHLQQRPLPTSVGAFKSHPLYALRRHLLKFEAIYPDSAIPVGYIKGEPVYARECVHTLHSRENWLKEGRAVRIGEEAYKFVKSRPKWNRPKEDPESKDLELFGGWQTEQYIPPPAVDGKVPRNAHGNVEMFLPSMLPAGTVHLKISGLNKVAKKLDIDCAPAMVGWDHHCGFSHPLMDGWIVCEEYKDILLAAWDEEQEIIREKEQQKREKRVYDNWRKLIRGMLIKERLKKRFDFETKPVEEKSEQGKQGEGKSQPAEEAEYQKSPELAEKADDKKLAWPQNRIDGKLCSVEKM